MSISDSLALSEGQRALQDSLRGFLADQLSAATLRSTLDTDPGYDPQLHARLTGQRGLAGLTIPAEFGGLGLSAVEASVMYTELGRALYPGPFLSSALAATVLLVSAGQETRERWLPLLADGSVTGAVAAADQTGRWSPGPDSVRAKLTTEGWQLSGRRWFVIAGHVASIIVVPAVTESGPAMFLIEPGAPGFEVSRHIDMDLTRRISVTSFDAAPAVLLSQDGDASAALARAEHEFLLATAAEAAGGIEWCLDASIAYAEELEQSELPPGSLGSIARSCADMVADFKSVSSAARYAAVATADGTTRAPMLARAAVLRAAEAYRDVTEAAVRLFSGTGSAAEDDVPLYYRRAWSAERLTGGPQAHKDAIDDLATRRDQADAPDDLARRDQADAPDDPHGPDGPDAPDAPDGPRSPD
jgi:alkylation response protein AidB-like acyl-CoA dehydrogenase